MCIWGLGTRQHSTLVAYLRHAHYAKTITSHQNVWLPLSDAYGIGCAELAKLEYHYLIMANSPQLETKQVDETMRRVLNPERGASISTGRRTRRGHRSRDSPCAPRAGRGGRRFRPEGSRHRGCAAGREGHDAGRACGCRQAVLYAVLNGVLRCF